MIHIYDSLTGEKRPFHKKPGETVSFYFCGPTVYDRAHLGHGRSAVAFDWIRRALQHLGYIVDQASNITDIDDKIIERANKENTTMAELCARIIPIYERDYTALKVLPPKHRPHATEYVQQMIELIQTLEVAGAAYVLTDGVYYDVSSFPEYGKLSHQKLDELQEGARVEAHKEKRNPQDFVLWKFKKEGEPFWASPWGDGRPGWHIECSAMSQALFGETLDIHGGGLDLKFPHHECEIAQSEKVSGKPLAHVWMHNGFVTVNEEKMSKSLGNFFTLEDIFAQYHPRIVRLFLLSAHYRSPIEFSNELLDQARATLRRLDEAYLKASHGPKTEDFWQKVQAAIESDFDSARILALTFESLDSLSSSDFETLEALLGIFPADFAVTQAQQLKITARNEARANRDFALSDQLRNELLEDGIELEDGAETFVRPRV